MPAIRRHVALPALLALAVLSTACVHVRATPLAGDIYAPVPADSVRIFATNPPPRYVELAMIRVEGFLANDGKWAKGLREKAGRLGANGVILLNARGAVVGGGSDIGVVIGGNNPSAIVFGDDDDDIKEFARAVAIRYDVQSMDSARVSASRP